MKRGCPHKWILGNTVYHDKPYGYRQRLYTRTNTYYCELCGQEEDKIKRENRSERPEWYPEGN